MKKYLIPIIAFFLIFAAACIASCDRGDPSGSTASTEAESLISPTDQPTEAPIEPIPVTEEPFTETDTEPFSELLTESGEISEFHTEPATDPGTETESQTEVYTEPQTEPETEAQTEPDPVLPGDNDLDRLCRILNDHNTRLDECAYIGHTESVNHTVMTMNGDVSESNETEIEDIHHAKDGSLYSCMTVTDDYESYTDKIWYIGGALYVDYSETERYKVCLTPDEYRTYVNESSGTMDDVVDLLSSEDIIIRWDRQSSTFNVIFTVTDPAVLQQLMATVMGDDANEYELSELSFGGSLTVDTEGRILNDKVRLGYAMSYFGFVMRAEAVSTESFDYTDSFEIVPPEDEASFIEVSIEEFFGE